MKTKQTIEQRINSIREKHALHRTQLFREGRELILQGVQLANGARGCAWEAEKGDSLHTAVDEADRLLTEAKTG